MREPTAAIHRTWIAEMIDVSPTYLSHVEQGKVDSPPTAKLVRVIAELLGENVDELTARAGRMSEELPGIIHSQPGAMPALLRAAKGLTPEQLKALMEKAKKMQQGEEGE